MMRHLAHAHLSRRCAACITRNIECEYSTAPLESHRTAVKRKHDELQGQNDAYRELYQIIASRPEQQAVAIFQKIRAGEDPDSLLRHVKAGELLLQMALVPETRYRYDFPVTAALPAYLDHSRNPYIHSMLYEKSFNRQTAQLQTGTLTVGEDPRAHKVYTAPFHAAKLVDSRIGSIKAARWTSVTSDDKLVRRLLEVWFVMSMIWRHPSIKISSFETCCLAQKLSAHHFL